MQTPTPSPVVTSFVQQIMPYLVMLVIALLTGMTLLVKAWVTKIVNQLEANHAATEAAGTQAVAAATNAATAATVASLKLDTVITQTNGVNQRLQDHIDNQSAQIAGLQSNQKT